MISKIRVVTLAALLCVSSALAGPPSQSIAFGDPLVDDGNLFAAAARQPGEAADAKAPYVVSAGANDFATPPLDPAAAIEASVGNLVNAVLTRSAAGGRAGGR